MPDHRPPPDETARRWLEAAALDHLTCRRATRDGLIGIGYALLAVADEIESLREHFLRDEVGPRGIYRPGDGA